MVRTILLLALLFVISGRSEAQDVIKLKGGTEIRAVIVEESSGFIRYREYENQDGPIYTVGRDKVESVTYRKVSGSRKETEVKKTVPDQSVDKAPEPGSAGMTYKKRQIFLDGVPQSPRQVITILDDYPEALGYFEKGRRQLSASSGCAIGIIVTSFAFGTASKNLPEEQQDIYLAAGLAVDAGFIIAAIFLTSGGKKKIRKACEIYNSSPARRVPYSINAGFQNHGIGLEIRF